MTYSTLLFDLDNTLLDTHANEKAGLIQLCQARHFPLTEDKIDYYHVLNEHLWQQFENQEIDRTYLLDHRLAFFFAHYGVTVDGPALQEQFSYYFHQQSQLIPGTIEVLTKLQTSHDLYVISNGTRRKQHAQMQAAHLNSFFKQVFLSEDIGFRKPDHHFFDYIETQLTAVAPEDMLVVGDSLTADIAGANLAGLDSVWFNPTEAVNPGQSTPTYEITTLKQLLTSNY